MELKIQDSKNLQDQVDLRYFLTNHISILKYYFCLVGHKLDKVGGKAKKSLSSLKLNKDKKNLDSVPEDKEIRDGMFGSNLNLDPGVNSDDEDNIDDIFKVFKNLILTKLIF